MSLNIASIKNRGDLNGERIVISVNSEVDIGNFLVLQTGVRNDNPTTRVKRCFWFPDREVSKGDLIVIYSKKGEKKEKKNPSGSTTHFFYWSSEEPLWIGENSAAVLIKADSWQGFTPSDFS